MTSQAGFPFSAVVGLAEARLALLLAAIDPGIGGVLLRGDKGSAKSTLARGLAGLLPGGAPFVELPLGATEDRVVGTLDIKAALTEGETVFRPGLLAAAHGGVLYVDEVNLLPDHLVDVLLDVAASGVNQVERDGVSHTHPARFVLVGSMNPEEGELRPQLLDRFGLSVEIKAPTDPLQRAEVVRRRLTHDAGGQVGAPEGDILLRARLAASMPADLPDTVVDFACRLAVSVGAEGLRADLVLCRAAAAFAGWEGRSVASTSDVERVASVALGHRRRRRPFDPPTLSGEELRAALDAARRSFADAYPRDEPAPAADRVAPLAAPGDGDGGAHVPAGDRPHQANGGPVPATGGAASGSSWARDAAGDEPWSDGREAERTSWPSAGAQPTGGAPGGPWATSGSAPAGPWASPAPAAGGAGTGNDTGDAATSSPWGTTADPTGDSSDAATGGHWGTTADPTGDTGSAGDAATGGHWGTTADPTGEAATGGHRGTTADPAGDTGDAGDAATGGDWGTTADPAAEERRGPWATAGSAPGGPWASAGTRGGTAAGDPATGGPVEPDSSGDDTGRADDPDAGDAAVTGTGTGWALADADAGGGLPAGGEGGTGEEASTEPGAAVGGSGASGLDEPEDRGGDEPGDLGGIPEAAGGDEPGDIPGDRGDDEPGDRGDSPEGAGGGEAGDIPGDRGDDEPGDLGGIPEGAGGGEADDGNGDEPDGGGGDEPDDGGDGPGGGGPRGGDTGGGGGETGGDPSGGGESGGDDAGSGDVPAPRLADGWPTDDPDDDPSAPQGTGSWPAGGAPPADVAPPATERLDVVPGTGRPSPDAGPHAPGAALGVHGSTAVAAPVRPRVAAHPGDGAPGGVALAATVRAAARRRQSDPTGPIVTADDVRGSVRSRTVGRTVVMVVDASGTVGTHRRVEAATGAILGLLSDAYLRRDRVAMVTFRGDAAEVVLPPTASVELARTRLAELPTGGVTPLAEGLSAGLSLARRAAADGWPPLLVVIGDGRATGNQNAAERVQAAAAEVAAAGLDVLVVDTAGGTDRQGPAAELATEMGARLLRPDEVTAGGIESAVRAALR